jgi:hypothetical protein
LETTRVAAKKRPSKPAPLSARPDGDRNRRLFVKNPIGISDGNVYHAHDLHKVVSEPPPLRFGGIEADPARAPFVPKDVKGAGPGYPDLFSIWNLIATAHRAQGAP